MQYTTFHQIHAYKHPFGPGLMVRRQSLPTRFQFPEIVVPRAFRDL